MADDTWSWDEESLVGDKPRNMSRERGKSSYGKAEAFLKTEPDVCRDSIATMLDRLYGSDDPSDNDNHSCNQLLFFVCFDLCY